jgi:hypothetical protein
MFLLYHSEGCNICESVLHECYVNDLYTTTCSGMLGHHNRAIGRISSGPPDGFGARPKTLPEHQFGGPARIVRSAAGRPGLGSALAEPGAEQVSFRREFHRLSFAHETPSPVNLNLYAYFSNISSHKARRVSQHSKSKNFLWMRTRKLRSNLGDVINEIDR